MAAVGSRTLVAPAQQPRHRLSSPCNQALRPRHPQTRFSDQCVAAALPRLADLGSLFGARSQKQQQGTRCRKASQELLELLITPSSTATGNSKDSKAQQQQDTTARLDELLDILVACEGVSFNEQLLAGGPWLVLYTRGTSQLWKTTYQAGKAFNSSNAASQDLDPSDRTVVNKAEYAGKKLYVTASGTYEPLGDTPVLPVPVQANITSGLLHILGLDVPLPIRGTGQFEVLYLDDNLRVFRSGGAISVQIKQQYLDD